MNRRDFFKASAAVAALPVTGCVAQPMRLHSPYRSAIPDHEVGTVVNDVHSQLNATRVESIVKPRDVEELRKAILDARSSGTSVSVSSTTARTI